MRIMIVMAGYFPGKKYGGPPVSIENFCSLLAEHECFIICKDHDMDDSGRYPSIACGWNGRPHCRVMYLSDSEYNYHTFERIAKEIRPDWLYMQGLFQACVLPCLRLAKNCHIKLLLAPRGELCGGALKRKAYKKFPYLFFLRFSGLLKNVVFQSTSDEETAAIVHYLKIPLSRIHFLPNVPSLPDKTYDHPRKEPGSGRFVFLGRIHPHKNILAAISWLHSVKSNASLDIYGPIEDQGYWGECLSEIRNLPKNIQVNYRGLIGHGQVHETMAKYDAFVMPTHSENYGHSIAEALVVGIPVVISDQTPWTDVNDFKAGWALPLNLPQEHVRAMQTIIDMNQEEMEVMRKAIHGYLVSKLKINELHLNYNSVLAGN